MTGESRVFSSFWTDNYVIAPLIIDHYCVRVCVFFDFHIFANYLTREISVSRKRNDRAFSCVSHGFRTHECVFDPGTTRRNRARFIIITAPVPSDRWSSFFGASPWRRRCS